MSEFYDNLAPFYHLIYPDWEASIERQAAKLDSLIMERCRTASTVFDVACGIGTQSLGLAALGYDVTASDLSAVSVERARVEAHRRGLSITFNVGDMRVPNGSLRTFDVVIACDNAIAHLLTDADLQAALSQMYASTTPGGVCLVSCRNYDDEPSTGTNLKPYGVREEDGARYILWQVWEFVDGTDTYNGDFYLVEDKDGEARVEVMRSTYRAVRLDRLAQLMSAAGFVDVRRFDDRFFQPIVVGSRP